MPIQSRGNERLLKTVISAEKVHLPTGTLIPTAAEYSTQHSETEPPSHASTAGTHTPYSPSLRIPGKPFLQI